MERKIYSVSDLARLISWTMEGEIGMVWVEGELSGARVAGSYGYTYFTIKDANAQISGIMSRQVRARLAEGVSFEDGDKVRIYGEVTFYEVGGRLQIKVARVEAMGLGDLLRRLEELKRKLRAEGLFDEERKRKLPLLPQRIGVVTSEHGSVIHDIVTVLQRRFHNLHLRLYPVRVQGEGAALEVAAAIQWFNLCCGSGSEWPADLLIVGRGGGSLEDLWAFNEEVLVRAVAASHIPIVSAVGHQDDWTLCDFAADLRAATPSVAAEQAIRPKDEFEADIMQLSAILKRTLQARLEVMRGRLALLAQSSALKRPLSVVEKRAQHLDMMGMGMRNALGHAVQQERRRIMEYIALLERRRDLFTAQGRERINLTRQGLQLNARHALERGRTTLKSVSAQLGALNPVSVLERGYTITRLEDGSILRHADDARPGVGLSTQTRDGVVYSVVR